MLKYIGDTEEKLDRRLDEELNDLTLQIDSINNQYARLLLNFTKHSIII